MAAKTFRLANAAVNGFGRLLEADQTAATTATGWTVGKIATANDSTMVWGTENATGTFSTEAGTPKPPALAAGNALRSDTPLTGEFAAAAWSIVVAFRSVSTAYTGTIRARARVFRSVNADGSGATEITAATQVGSTSGAGSTTVDSTSTITWTPAAAFTLNNEYLFIVLACEIVTASGSNTADALLRTGTTTTGVRIVTSNMATLDASTVTLALTPSSTDTFAGVDADTEVLAFTISGVDAADFVDTNTESLGLIPSGTDIADYVESGTIPLSLRPYIAEEFPIAPFRFAPSGTDASVYRDAGAQDIDFLGSLDQFGAGIGISTAALAQQFTAPSNTILLGVVLKLVRAGAVTGNLTVELRPDSGTNTPSATVLKTFTFPLSDLGDGVKTEYAVAFGGDALAVTSGTKYWIVAYKSVSGDTVNWRSNNDNIYPNNFKATLSAGNWSANTQDWHFAVRFDSSTSVPRIGLAPSSSDVADFVDSDTQSLVLTPNGTDVYTPGAGGTIYTDAATEALALTPTSTEEHTTFDAATETLALTANGADIAATQDSGTESFIFTPSGVDIREIPDAATESLVLTPSDTEVFAGVDQATERIAFTPAGVDTGQFVDVGTGTVAFSPSSADIEEFIEAATERLAFSVLSTELANFMDQAREDFNLIISGTDQYQAFGGGTDAATQPLSLLPSAADTEDYVDSITTKLALVPSVSELEAVTDSATGTITAIPASDDIAQTVESNVVYLYAVPSGVDIKQGAGALNFTDSGTIYLRFTIKANEFLKLYDVIAWLGGTRLFAKIEDKIYNGTVAFRRWWSSVGTD